MKTDQTRRGDHGLAVARALSLAIASLVLTFLVFSSSALAASQPSIEGDSAYNLTPTDATLEATINPGSLPEGAYYQFQVVTNTSEYLPEIACPPRAELKGTDGCMGPEVEGVLPIGSVPDDKSVSLDLASAGMTLKPGTIYHYRVLAVEAKTTEDTLEWVPPAVVGPDQSFTTPLASAPTIESEGASHVTEDGAKLEATINPEDLPEGVFYQFQVVKNTSEYLPELACPERSVQLDGDDGCGVPGPGGGHPTPGALPIGFIETGSAGQSVSESLAAAGMTLQPSTTYHYRVLAVKKVQAEDGVDWQGPFVEGPDQTFTTPPAGKAPSIDSVSISNLSPSDATLEAQINTEGQETTYEFLLWSSPCSRHGAGCEVILDVPLPSGELLGSFLDQSVSLDLNSAGVTLRGGEYGYSVKATNGAGSAESKGQTFEPPPSPPTIDSESVSGLSEHDATLEAQLDPNGAYTAYEFQIDTNGSYNYTKADCPLPLPEYGECESITVGATLAPGLVEPHPEYIPAGSGDRPVSLDLASIGASLEPGTTYHYRAIASNGGQIIEGPDQTFTTPNAQSNSGGTGTQTTGQITPQAGGGASDHNTGVPNNTLRPEALTAAQKLRKTLKLCEKKPKRHRLGCERQARKKYSMAKQSKVTSGAGVRTTGSSQHHASTLRGALPVGRTAIPDGAVPRITAKKTRPGQ